MPARFLSQAIVLGGRLFERCQLRECLVQCEWGPLETHNDVQRPVIHKAVDDYIVVSANIRLLVGRLALALIHFILQGHIRLVLRVQARGREGLVV